MPAFSFHRASVFLCILAIVALAGVTQQRPAHAQIRFWNAVSGDWTNGANWHPSPPGPGIVAHIDNGGTAELSSGGSAGSLYIGGNSGTTGNLQIFAGGGLSTGDAWVGDAGTGTATVSTGSWSTTNFRVGNVGTGTVNVTSGGTLNTSGRAELGVQAFSTGSVNLNGLGTRWDADGSTTGLDIGLGGTGNLYVFGGALVESRLGRIGVNAGAFGVALLDSGRWTLTNTLSVGDSGKGTLTIQNGGTIADISVAPTAHGYIGRFTNSDGEVNVTGANSSWTVGRSLFVADAGMGKLNINAGGTVTSPTSGTIGESASSVGEVTVDGKSPGPTGTPSKWTMNGALTVGNFGKGTLKITGGGLVESRDQLFGAAIVGRQANSEGAVTVSGAGSQWKHGDRLEVGSFGKGTLTMGGGGTVVNVNDWDIYIGRHANSDGTVTVNAGSTWTASNGFADLYVGDFGKGRLLLEGGTLQSDNTFIGNSFGPVGAEGIVVVDQGSMWTNTGVLSIGRDGSGVLTIRRAGKVESTDARIGELADSSGEAFVSDTGSQWKIDGDLYVGDAGTGMLTVASGGRLESIYGDIGYSGGSTGTVFVSGFSTDNTASLWKLTEDLTVGYDGNGTLDISARGRVESKYGDIGYFSGVTGTVSVRGEGSLWKITEDLTVGFDGLGTLDILSGGAVENKGGSVGGSNVANRVTVDGKSPGGTPSKWTNSLDLSVGDSGTGELNVTGGAMVQCVNGYIGDASGVMGKVKVEGTGSLWKNTGQLSVGDSGIATLDIFSGGRVENTIGYVGNSSSGSTGTVNVRDGAVWKNSGSLEVGAFGKGTLNIMAGGVVENTDGYIHRFTSSAESVVTVDGKLATDPTKPSTWTNTGNLYVGSRGAGAGKLNVTGGAKVTNNTGYIGYLGAASNGMVKVEGDGSEWTNQVALVVGHQGRGVLDIKSGGTVSGNTADIGFNTGSRGDVTIDGVSSSMVHVANVRVGGGGIGTLTAQAGGGITQDGGTLSVLNNGQVNVTGAQGGIPSSLDILPSGDTTPGLDVGGGTGLGKVNVTAGGKIRGGDRSARIDGLAGTLVEVDGVGSAWTEATSVTIGRFAFGHLKFTNGGSGTFASSALIGFATGSSGEVTVVGPEAASRSNLTVPTLQVGIAGTGRLNIGNYATVTNTSVVLGGTSDGVAIVNVDGSSSSWVVSQTLTVGHSGDGTLNIKNGGRVESVNGTIGTHLGSVGNVLIENGTWALDAKLGVGLDGTGVLDVRSGGSVTTANVPDGVVFGPLGEVMGTGTINGNVINNGKGKPGNSPGTLHINGDYTQGATGRLEIELASTASYDVLDVTGQANLNGILELVLTDGFMPSAGDTFNILTAASLSGTFSDVIVTSSSGGGTFNLGFTPSGVSLSNFQPAAGLPGDFNTDGKVDAADYVVWRKGLGTVYTPNDFNLWRANFGRTDGAAPLPGDFNEDGTVDAADYIVWRKNPGGIYTQNDFNIWRTHFGQTAGAGSGVGANGFEGADAIVPEPTTQAIFVVAIMLMFASQRARRS